MKAYLARLRRGKNPMSFCAIDFYEQDGVIIKHTWGMGGESKQEVESVPVNIDGFERVDECNER